MAIDNPFVLPTSSYTRDLNLLQAYVKDNAKYLAKMTGKPLEQCMAFVHEQVKPGGQFELKDPPVVFLEREPNGDRVKQEGTLSQYIGESIKARDLIAPTLTTYVNPAEKQSLLVDFIDGNVAARNVAKKAMFVAKVAGDKVVESFKKGEQTNKKLSNNALSGGHVSASTPLFNRTAHSTLTSNCRSTSGYGNANNEKYLCGNRHYWSPEITRANIISLINNTDYGMFERTMAEFGIRHPTIEETVECVTWSTKLYWTSKIEMARIEQLIHKLTDIERSAVVYTGDLYHLMRFNEELVRKFINRLSARIDDRAVDAQEVFSTMPEEYVHLAAQICSEEMKGKAISRHPETKRFHIPIKKDPKISRECSEPYMQIVGATVLNIAETLQDYRNLIRCFWVTDNVPASMAHFPDSIRRAAITSDTDSTIFTVQDWVIWHRGKLKFDTQAKAVAATMIFLASQTITHVLAKMSANFGIETKRLHQIAMKNEFYFPVFTPTQVAKHYFALIGSQEGNVNEEFDKEIKGVHLKSSNAPKAVTLEAKKMMEYIMNTVVEEKQININFILKWIADIERDVIASIKKGSYSYFRKGQIKTPESYTKEREDSPYAQFTFWQEVFAPKYGESQHPPYMSVKVSTSLDTPSRAKEWIASLEDRELATRIEAYMQKTGRKHLGSTFMLPEQCIASKGIPEEILAAVGVRNIVLDTTKIFYIILETLGIYMLNKKTTRLVSDTH